MSWYEASLSTHERRVRGHYSTPPSLVDVILDAVGYTTDAHLPRLRVLDPACGSGNFLAGAAQRLLTYAKGRALSPAQTLAMLQRNLWGFDPDPVACFLAEMQLRTLLEEHDITRQARGKFSLHVHQADGLAFPWEQVQRESVDLFLANPPYLAAKNTDLSNYRLMQEFGQADSYLFFLRLALQIVRPNGWIGLVLPDPVLARANAARERQRLLQETTVHFLWHLSNVFPAYVGAVVLIAQKRPPARTHQIAWTRQKWSKQEEKSRQVDFTQVTTRIPQQLLRDQTGAELRYLLGNEAQTLVKRLHMCTMQGKKDKVLTPLENIVSIRRGEELGKKNGLVVDKPPAQEGWRALLLGGVDVRPYAHPQGEHWIEERVLDKPLARYSAPKLLVVKSTNVLQAALDVQGHVALQTLYLLLPIDATLSLDTLYFLLALLNSRLLQRYVYVLHTAYKLVQPQIEQHVLARLPIPVAAPESQQEIALRAREIMDACGDESAVVELRQQLYEEQERAICALYEYALDL